MAFLNSKNKYIRLKENGRVDIYSSQEARERRKTATDSDIIFNKYQEIIDEQIKNIYDYVEANNIDITEMSPEKEQEILDNHPYIASCAYVANKWSAEKYQYEDDFYAHKGCTKKFPLMETYFPDIQDSIPDIIEMVFIPWNTEKIEEIYQQAKERKIFGETKDC